MFDDLRCAVEQLRRLLAGLEPDRFDGAGARTLVELFDEIERLGAAGKALATRQVVATGAWKHDGAHRDVASWLSATTGSTLGAARATLETPERVEALPTTEAAWRSGALSSAQVSAIADAAAADPGAEHELLVRAAHDGVRGLRGRVCAGEGGGMCRRVRAVRARACVTVAPVLDRPRRRRPDRHPRSGRLHRPGDEDIGPV